MEVYVQTLTGTNFGTWLKEDLGFSSSDIANIRSLAPGSYAGKLVNGELGAADLQRVDIDEAQRAKLFAAIATELEKGPGTRKFRCMSYVLPLEGDTKAEVLKRMVEEIGGIPVDQQRILFGGKQFSDNRPLRDYGVKHGDFVTLVLRLRGD